MEVELWKIVDQSQESKAEGAGEDGDVLELCATAIVAAVDGLWVSPFLHKWHSSCR